MRILVYDKKGRYASFLVKRLLDICKEVMIFTENEDAIEGKTNVVFGKREEKQDIKKLDIHYDVIIDTDVVTMDTLSMNCQAVSSNFYISFSSMQVYSLLGAKKCFVESDVICENIYSREINETETSYLYKIEQLKCENLIKKIYNMPGKSCVILRIPKVYSSQDHFGIIRWILWHEKNNYPYIIGSNDLFRKNEETPIYIEDLCNLIRQIVINGIEINDTINISQSEIINFFDLVKYVKCAIGSNEDIKVVTVDRGKIGISYRTPISEGFILNNKKVIEQYDISFTPTKEWVNKIVAVLMLEKKALANEEDGVFIKKIIDAENKKYLRINSKREKDTEQRVINYEKYIKEQKL